MGAWPGPTRIARRWRRPPVRATASGVPFQQVYDEVAAETCLGYLPDSAEISGSVLFLASDLARPVTGQWFAVNAGQYLP